MEHRFPAVQAYGKDFVVVLQPQLAVHILANALGRRAADLDGSYRLDQIVPSGPFDQVPLRTQVQESELFSDSVQRRGNLKLRTDYPLYPHPCPYVVVDYGEAVIPALEGVAHIAVNHHVVGELLQVGPFLGGGGHLLHKAVKNLDPFVYASGYACRYLFRSGADPAHGQRGPQEQDPQQDHQQRASVKAVFSVIAHRSVTRDGRAPP